MEFVDDYSILSMFELTMFVFTHISKNKLLLANMNKKSYFEKLQQESGPARITHVMDKMYTKLEEEYCEDGMIFYD